MKPRRLIPRLLLCLTLGFVTTIAGAWSSAALDVPVYARLSRHGIPRFPYGPDVFSVFGSALYSHAGAERVDWSLAILTSMPAEERAQVIYEDAMLELPQFERAGVFPRPWGRAPELARSDFGYPIWVQDARGWPMLALWCDWKCDDRGCARSAGAIDLAPLSPSPSSAICNLRALPYRPIPLGLLADTLIFAFAWFTLLFAPRAIGRRIRIARNLCPACAYNLAGLPPQTPCPECGHAPPPPTEPRP